MKDIFPAFFSCQGTVLTDEEKFLFEKTNPLGVCLFSLGCENIKNKAQLQKLTTEIRETIGRDDVMIAVDQEGGRVRRLTGQEFTEVTSQSRITTAEMSRQHAYLTSTDLKSCGINVNFAPVLDIEYKTTGAALQGRCFSGNERKVAELGAAAVQEYLKNGVCPCLKHLPGHGRAKADPHLELPVINEGLEVLEKDFYPFRSLNTAPLGMVAHITLAAVDKENPASLSAKVIKEIIRGKIGFEGLLVSDAVVMKALSGSITERAERSLAAGCDIVCLGNAGFQANQELAEVKAVLTDEAREKLAGLREIFRRQPDFSLYEYVKKNYCEFAENIVTYESEYDATEVLNRLRQA